MTGLVTSPDRSHTSLTVAALAAVSLIISGTQASADPGQTRFKIVWSACENRHRPNAAPCACHIDWSKPSGATISLAVARRPAKDPQQRVGTLFFNPGGPGDGAAKYIVEAETFFAHL